jgi:hypothetical protein
MNINEKIQKLTKHSSVSTTGLVPSPNPMSKLEYKFLLLPECNADERCGYWLGALNNVITIGCGINVLRFMGEIDETNALKGLKLTFSQDGTPFHLVKEWFQQKLNNMGVFPQDGYIRTVEEYKYDITTKYGLEVFFYRLNYFLPNNSCVLVKYNRSDIPARRPGRLTAGHYVLISKNSLGKLITYEPITSNKNKCDTREYKGHVSDRFFSAFKSQGYITASVLILIVRPINSKLFKVQKGGTYEITENFLLPKDIYSDFINKLDESVECENKIGGKKNRKSKKNIRKSRKSSRKNKKTIKRTIKRTRK